MIKSLRLFAKVVPLLWTACIAAADSKDDYYNRMVEAFSNSHSSGIEYGDLEPLRSVWPRIKDDPHDAIFLCTRCSALFTALSSYVLTGVGDEEAAEKRAEELIVAAEAMEMWATRFATNDRGLSNEESHEVRSRVMAGIGTQMGILHKRFERNSVVLGTAFEKDTELADDLSVCQLTLFGLSQGQWRE